MSDIPEGHFAMVIVTEVKDSKSTICFERMSDYYEYLSMQKEVRDGRMSMFGDISKDKGELN
ncbi:hypothetical protein HWD03_gp056 [Alteromonas phage vB_AmeM_PT11-V22]|uniref:Uncharacterized protein n=1 Tax=Alteromonas phage vB_AmeM_PT11-V22 TaxID=2704031 RepID=A0A6C0R1P6_9CAUD|nr:hypothetical protein HWD03_gp056 [Alteromonas phage vB_AmeM_PT11-V22]QHZ59816.1 hypothetical protein [Alteromonas phage vB_AmeM_PT11-V22]